MASLYVAEIRMNARTHNGGMLQAPEMAPVAEQKLTISGGSAQSSAFNASTLCVRVHTDAICHVAFGDNPTADSNNLRMAADQTEYFGVTPGQKLAVISGV